MMTEKLYQKDMYLKECQAFVESYEAGVLVLDRTVFAPDAGGQPFDLGTIDGHPVKAVHEKAGVISHLLEDEGLSFKKGDQVRLELDWERRFDHMQNHLGEHILSAIFKSEYGLDNKGFHLGDEEGTFDIDSKEISQEMLDRVELLANQVVYRAIPVEIRNIESAEEALKLPLRKELKAEEDISVVIVEGVDCVACCCPHPADTSQIGLIKLLKTEKYKGMTRIHYKCGRRALLDYIQKNRVMTVLGEKYSADEFTLLDKIKAQDDKNDAQHRELNRLRDMLAELRAKEIIDAGGEGILIGELEKATMDDLRKIVKKLTAMTDLPVAVSSASDLCMLLSHSGKSKLKCGALVKEFAVGNGGKGGGGDTQAQVIFNSLDLMRNFAVIVKSSVQ